MTRLGYWGAVTTVPLILSGCLTPQQAQTVQTDATWAESAVATGTYAACSAVSAAAPVIGLIPDPSVQSVVGGMVTLCNNSAQWESSSAEWINRNLATVLALATKK